MIFLIKNKYSQKIYCRSTILSQSESEPNQLIKDSTLVEGITKAFTKSLLGSIITPNEWGYMWIIDGIAELFCYNLLNDHIINNYSDIKTFDALVRAKMIDTYSDAQSLTEHVYETSQIIRARGFLLKYKGILFNII